jgi:hypothetical protein
MKKTRVKKSCDTVPLSLPRKLLQKVFRPTDMHKNIYIYFYPDKRANLCLSKMLNLATIF